MLSCLFIMTGLYSVAPVHFKLHLLWKRPGNDRNPLHTVGHKPTWVWKNQRCNPAASGSSWWRDQHAQSVSVWVRREASNWSLTWLVSERKIIKTSHCHHLQQLQTLAALTDSALKKWQAEMATRPNVAKHSFWMCTLLPAFPGIKITS